MIWNEELSASLDQSGGVVVFHRIDLSRTQQLAQTMADKVAAMVEQNEKALDIKMGGTGGWGERGDGNKGEKRGETQERRGRGDRTRGGARGKFCTVVLSGIMRTNVFVSYRWSTRWTRRSVLSRTRKPNAVAEDTIVYGVFVCMSFTFAFYLNVPVYLSMPELLKSDGLDSRRFAQLPCISYVVYPCLCATV